MFALHTALGVSEKRCDELSAELHELLHAPDGDMETVCQELVENHDPEAVLIGAFLGLAILMNDNRVLPKGYQLGVNVAIQSEPGALN